MPTIIINKGEKVYDGSLNNIRSMSNDTKIIKLKLNGTVDNTLLQSYGKLLKQESGEAVLEIHGNVRSTASELLNSFPIQDIAIEDIPIEQNIAILYQGQGKKGEE
jgi:ABC-2 type transport system ATP-binding protein